MILYNKFQGRVKTVPVYQSEIDASVISCTYDELEAELELIRASNNHSGQVEVVAMPISTMTSQDGYSAFVSEDMPTLSYNKNHSIIASNGKSKYEAFFRFINPVPTTSNLEIKEAYIYLDKPNYINYDNVDIKISECLQIWEDNNISWLKRPQSKDSYTSYKDEGGNIRIDATQHYADVYQSGSRDYGFRITTTSPLTVDFKSFASQFKPKLVVKYVDLATLNVEIMNFPAEVNIIPVYYKELNAEVTLDLMRNELPVEVMLTRPELGIETTLAYDSELDVSMDLSHESNSEIIGEVSLSFPEMYKEIPFDFNVGNKSEMEAEVNLLGLSTISAEALLGKTSELDSYVNLGVKSELDTEFIILVTDVKSHIDASMILTKQLDSDLSLECDTRMYDELEAELDLQFNRAELPCQFTLAYTSELDVEANIFKIGSSEITASFFYNVLIKQLPVELELQKPYELPIEFDFDRNKYSYLDVEFIFAKKTDSDLDTECNVVMTKNSDINVELELNKFTINEIVADVDYHLHSELDSRVDVMFFNELMAEVGLSNISELDCEFNIGVHSDLITEVNVASISDLQCELELAFVKDGRSDLPIELDLTFIRDLNVEITVATMSELDSSVIVSIKNDNLAGELDLRFSKDLDASVNVYFYSNLEFEFMFEPDDFDGYAYIIEEV